MSIISTSPSHNNNLPKPSHNAAMKQVLKVASLISFAAISQSALAGAWTAAEGGGYNKLAVSGYEATDFYGDSEGFDEFKGDNYSLYFEHGVRDDITLFGTFLYQDLEQTNSAGLTTTNDGFSDSDRDSLDELISNQDEETDGKIKTCITIQTTRDRKPCKWGPISSLTLLIIRLNDCDHVRHGHVHHDYDHRDSLLEFQLKYLKSQYQKSSLNTEE